MKCTVKLFIHKVIISKWEPFFHWMNKGHFVLCQNNVHLQLSSQWFALVDTLNSEDVFTKNHRIKQTKYKDYSANFSSHISLLNDSNKVEF